jgi:hypothetical protein
MESNLNYNIGGKMGDMQNDRRKERNEVTKGSNKEGKKTKLFAGRLSRQIFGKLCFSPVVLKLKKRDLFEALSCIKVCGSHTHI